MASSSSMHAQDPSFLASFNTWRRSVAQLTGLGLTPEEKAQRDQTVDAEKAAKQCKACESYRDELIQTSPIVRFMLAHVASLPTPSYSEPPSPISPSTANSPVPIYCAPCGPDRGGGFSPGLGVILCQDRIFSKKHVEDTLAHELIHEWDHRRFKVDWQNLKMVACSEIRAAALSGDCRWGRELKRRNFAFTKQHQVCARRRAVLSLLQHPAMRAETAPGTTMSTSTAGDDELRKRKEKAERIVNEVWESCWKDTRPFDEIY